MKPNDLSTRTRSNDLEIPRQFPIRDRLAELALLPGPGGGVVVDEGVAEPVNPPSEALPQVASEVKTGTEEPANELNGNAPQSDQPASTPTPEPAPKEAELPQKQPESNPAVGVTVYGQAHLNRLLTTLFPYKAANNPPKDEE